MPWYLFLTLFEYAQNFIPIAVLRNTQGHFTYVTVASIMIGHNRTEPGAGAGGVTICRLPEDFPAYGSEGNQREMDLKGGKFNNTCMQIVYAIDLSTDLREVMFNWIPLVESIPVFMSHTTTPTVCLIIQGKRCLL